jgi:hypothetical protein
MNISLDSMAKIMFLLVTVEKSAEADRQPNPHRNRVDMAQGKKAAPAAESAAEKEARLTTIKDLGAAQCSLEEVRILMGREKRKKLFGTEEEIKAYQKGRVEALKQLRMAQLEMAKKSVPMATMLGRIYLGQSEQREQDEDAPIDYAAIAERYRAKDLVAADPGAAQTD